jgi:hypothetical protein
MKRRTLKKDIKYLAAGVIEESYDFIVLYPQADHEVVKEAIENAFVLHDEFILRVNHPDGKDNPAIVKNYYKQLRADLYEQTAGLYAKIEAEFNKVSKEG